VVAVMNSSLTSGVLPEMIKHAVVQPLNKPFLFVFASKLRKSGISFHCYADDRQIYGPLKKKNDNSVGQLLDIKAWMALNFFNFNDKKQK